MNAALPKDAVQGLDADTLSLRVRAIRMEAEGIHAFELVHPDGVDLPQVQAGAHVDVHLPGGLVRSYSLAGDPATESVGCWACCAKPMVGAGRARCTRRCAWAS